MMTNLNFISRCRYSELNAKILPLMEDYMVALRSRDNTPAPLLTMDREHEEQMIDNFKAEIEAKRREKEEQEAEQEEEEKEATTQILIKEETEEPTTQTPEPVTHDAEKTLKVEVHATAVHHDIHVEPRVAHVQSHDFGHNQGAYTVRRVQASNNSSVTVIVLVAGCALLVALVAGILINRRRSARYSHQQLVSKIGRTKDGFIEVDTAASPEEKHVAAMQVNGYENPTYRYFEAGSN